MLEEQRFVRLDGETFGPMAPHELAQLRASKRLRAGDAISNDGATWTLIDAAPDSPNARWWFPWVMTAAMVVFLPVLVVVCVGAAAVLNDQLYPEPARTPTEPARVDDNVAVATWQFWTGIQTALSVPRGGTGEFEPAMHKLAADLDRLPVADVDPQGIAFLRRLSAILRRAALLSQLDDGTGHLRRSVIEGAKDLPTHLPREQEQQLRDFTEELSALRADARRLMQEFQQRYGHEFPSLEF